MKSRTSFFNAGVLKKDVLRFAPLWGVYTVIILLMLFLEAQYDTPAELGEAAPYLMQSMAVINLFYGGIAAVLLFGDLFNSRLCNALHTFPLRREGWFLTHLTSGLLFCLVPNTLTAVIGTICLGQYAYLAWLWLAVSVLAFLCFFGIGVFSAQLAGTGLGAFTSYLLLNFLPVLAWWLIGTFYSEALYGVSLEDLQEKLALLSPVIRLSDCKFVDVMKLTAGTEEILRLRGFHKAEWVSLFCAAGAGLALMAGAAALYRKRHLERAGDFLAVKAAKPVFLLLYTLCLGALFSWFGSEDAFVKYVLMTAGFVVAFFTGWMLLEKRVRVFRARRFAGLAVLLALIFGSIILVWVDPVGVTRYVPAAENVETVTISPYKTTDYADYDRRTLYEIEDIDSIRGIHQQLAENRAEADTDSHLVLTYKLKNGTSVTRQYWLKSDSPEGKILKDYYSHMEVVFGTQDIRGMLLNTEYIEFYSHLEEFPSMVFTDDRNYNGGEDPKYIYGENYVEQFIEGSIADDARVQGLIQAIEQDCQAGTMAQFWEYHRNNGAIGYVTFCLRQDRYSTRNINISIYEDSENTVAYLKTMINN